MTESILKRLYHAIPTPPNTNYLYRSFDVNPYKLLPNNALIFDIGSKEMRGRYSFGPPPAGSTVKCVDISPGEGVDLVADAHNMNMVADNSVDCVCTVSTLEHVRYPQKVVAEIYRILKPGGLIYVSVPFIFPWHGDPDDFYRFSHHGIKILCEQFERLDSGFNRGPSSTMHELLVRYFAILFSFRSRALYGVLLDLFRWLLFWVKYLDVVTAKHPMAHVIHAGAYFIGRKPSSPSAP